MADRAAPAAAAAPHGEHAAPAAAAPPHGEHAHTNRLAGAHSPYLLLHQHNPVRRAGLSCVWPASAPPPLYAALRAPPPQVNWLPWGDEAIQLAKRQDKPIFLSVGYATCHW